jgi:hypothetical protein
MGSCVLDNFFLYVALRSYKTEGWKACVTGGVQGVVFIPLKLFTPKIRKFFVSPT